MLHRSNPKRKKFIYLSHPSTRSKVWVFRFIPSKNVFSWPIFSFVSVHLLNLHTHCFLQRFGHYFTVSGCDQWIAWVINWIVVFYVFIFKLPYFASNFFILFVVFYNIILLWSRYQSILKKLFFSTLKNCVSVRCLVKMSVIFTAELVRFSILKSIALVVITKSVAAVMLAKLLFWPGLLVGFSDKVS